jgi:hypothetical protein
MFRWMRRGGPIRNMFIGLTEPGMGHAAENAVCGFLAREVNFAYGTLLTF